MEREETEKEVVAIELVGVESEEGMMGRDVTVRAKAVKDKVVMVMVMVVKETDLVGWGLDGLGCIDTEVHAESFEEATARICFEINAVFFASKGMFDKSKRQ